MHLLSFGNLIPTILEAIMQMSVMDWLTLVAIILGPGGGAALSVKLTLNGMRKDVKETAKRTERMEGKLDDHEHRLSFVEGQLINKQQTAQSQN